LKGKLEEEISEFVDEGNREKIPPDVPPAFAKLIKSCWEQSIKDRPELSDVIGELEKLQASYPIVDKL